MKLRIIPVGQPLIDHRLYAAIVDRFTSNGDIMETGTPNYRLAHARQRTTNK